MSKNNKRSFVIPKKKKHMKYLAYVMVQAMSKMDIKTGNIAEGINFLDKHDKLTENDRKFIIFSIGMNIGIEHERFKNQQDQQKHYR